MILGQTTRLRRAEGADADLLARCQDDVRVMRGWGHAAPLPSRDALERDAAATFAESASEFHLIIENSDGALIGRLDVMRIDPRHRSAELAVHIVETADGGQGYGTDALAAVCRYLFDQRALHRLALTVTVDDERAIRVYELVGFRREGTLRRHLWTDGSPCDELAMSLLAGELIAPR